MSTGAFGVDAVRLAETALRSHGGFTVILRLPGMAASGNDAEQLGLGTADFQDVPVGPAVWRKIGVDTALLLGASAVATAVGSQGFASAEALFEAIAGVVVDDVMYTVANSEAVVAGGQIAGFRLSVVAPVRG